MKLSEQWLREWVNPTVTTEQLTSQLTMAGLEVDAVSPVAGEFSAVRVGLVKSVAPHPQADRLTLCCVDVGEAEPLSIVCGASNVRANLKVAVAMVGAKLPNGLKIKKSKLRGEPSHGMLCSEVELGLSDAAQGIMELGCDAPVGLDIRDYLLLDDTSIEVDLTPNRGDCLSVQGIAREVAVHNEIDFEPKQFAPVQPDIDDELSLSIEDFGHCGQYCGRIIRGINPHAKTPMWLSERLRRSGLRAIHPVVDVTNYVMLELGQPMHAFDLSKLDDAVCVRVAKEGESLVLLDGQTLSLRADTLVIADGEGAVAMAGIMGGEASAVSEETQDLFLESAYFNPIKLAGKGRSYGLSTDSSHRFERGVAPELQAQAIERASQLLLEIVGGKVGPVSCLKDENHLPQVSSLSLRPQKVTQLLGFNIADAQISSSLNRLGLSVDDKEVPWQVSVPPRRFDISIEEDLIEEVARVYGYHNIESVPMIAQVMPQSPCLATRLREQMSDTLLERGYNETISYSFVDPKLQTLLYGEAHPLSLVNPLSPELSEMRRGLWSGLLASVLHNQHRQISDLRLFEQGLCFVGDADDLSQDNHLAGVITGKLNGEKWHSQARNVDFYDIKGDVEAILSPYQQASRLSFVPAPSPTLHPGQSACIQIDGVAVGFVGALHPKLAAVLEFNMPVFLFELNCDLLLTPARAVYQGISKYPSIRRDLSFLADKDMALADIEQAIWAYDSEGLLRQFDVFDVYLGSNVPLGKKSMAIGLTLQHASRTLVESEINSFIEGVIALLGEKFDILLRE